MIASPRAFLEGLFRTAVAAAHPAACLPPHLPEPPRIRTADRPGGRQGRPRSMAEVAERHYLDERGMAAARIAGLAVTRRGYGRPTRLVRVIEAGHPVPDAAGLAATFETLSLADAAGPDDLVLALISGGASANWIAPAAGLTLAAKAGGDAGAARLRRLDRRDQHGAQASLAHQGRTAGRARPSGAR